MVISNDAIRRVGWGIDSALGLFDFSWLYVNNIIKHHQTFCREAGSCCIYIARADSIRKKRKKKKNEPWLLAISTLYRNQVVVDIVIQFVSLSLHPIRSICFLAALTRKRETRNLFNVLTKEIGEPDRASSRLETKHIYSKSTQLTEWYIARQFPSVFIYKHGRLLRLNFIENAT